MNIPLTSKKRVNKLDYLFVFLLIIYAGSATVFVRSLNTWEDLVGLIFICSFTLFYELKNKIGLKKNFNFLILSFIIYSFALTLKFGEAHYRFLGVYIISFWITYICVTTLKSRFFIIFEDIMFYLCIISLFFWVLHQIIPDQFAIFIESIAFSEPGSGNVKANIIFYTINNLAELLDYVIEFGPFKLIRNAGFAWEPGAFAVFITLALYVNFIKDKFNKIINKRFFIFLFALITTFSTTGYGIFILLIMFYTYNKHIKYRFFYLFISAVMGAYVLSLSFMSDKIISLSQENVTDELVQNSVNYDTKYTPQRVTSFLIDFKDFLNNPILGYGGHDEEMWTAKLGAEIATISGIGKVFARFGLVGAIFFFVMLYRSSKLQAEVLGYKGWGFHFVIIIMISISYSLIEHPLLMCFWMTALFYPKPEKYSKVTHNFKNKWLRQKQGVRKLQF